MRKRPQLFKLTMEYGVYWPRIIFDAPLLPFVKKVHSRNGPFCIGRSKHSLSEVLSGNIMGAEKVSIIKEGEAPNIYLS